MIQTQYAPDGTRSRHRIAAILASAGEFDVRPAAEAPSPAGAGEAMAPRRVLIIEDNRDAAETLRDYLELFGHEVCLAFTGPAGLEAATHFLPDVVLCDIGLPGLDGWNVARSLRSTPATSQARLIAVTGYGSEEDRRHSSEAGFEAHLTKPINIDQLEALLGSASLPKPSSESG